MKHYRYNFYFLTFVIISVTSLLLHSCSKEQTEEFNQVSIDEELGEFIKEITVFDKSRENSVVLLVGSNDLSILDMWTTESFTLTPIKEGQYLSDIFPADDLDGNENEVDGSVEEEYMDDFVAAEISYMIKSKKLAVGVENVALSEKPPYPDEMRGWRYSTHYSEMEEGNTVTVNIYGHNFWHRGYYAAYYIREPGNGWSTIKSEWARIRNGQEKSYTRTPCYWMKARRKYKGRNNNSVTIEFEY